jgi:fatty acid desaturase
VKQAVTRREPRARRGATRLFRYTYWDGAPVLMLAAHLALLVAFFFAWPHLAWPARLAGAALYGLAIGWSQDSVAHNFIHNPFFVSRRLNRLVAFALTLVNGAPQTMYAYVHMRHHAGNSDRRDAQGQTIDPISIYRHGRDGQAEGMPRYVLMGFWRDDGPFTVARAIRAKRPTEAREALNEFWLLVAIIAAAFALRWDFVVTLAPFYYLGQSFSFLIAYYEHFGARPEAPMETGVSTYTPLYNLLFLNNGFHAEHHFRPKQHWSRMELVRLEMIAAGSQHRVMSRAHFLGFLEPRRSP